MYTATTVQENHFRTIPITRELNHHITQVIEEDHQNEEIHKIHQKIITIDQIVEITTPDQIRIQHNLFLDLIPNQGIITIQTINHETHHTIEIETTPIIEIEVIQTIETRITRTIDQGITHIIDQTITDQTIIIKTDHKILQNENLKAAPNKSHFFLTRVKFLGHNIERKTITPLKSRIDAIQKLQPPTNKKKIQEFLEC